MYSDRGMNTFNSAVKNKEIQCERIATQVSQYYFTLISNALRALCRVAKHLLPPLICTIPKEIKAKVGH